MTYIDILFIIFNSSRKVCSKRVWSMFSFFFFYFIKQTQFYISIHQNIFMEIIILAFTVCSKIYNVLKTNTKLLSTVHIFIQFEWYTSNKLNCFWWYERNTIFKIEYKHFSFKFKYIIRDAVTVSSTMTTWLYFIFFVIN